MSAEQGEAGHASMRAASAAEQRRPAEIDASTRTASSPTEAARCAAHGRRLAWIDHLKVLGITIVVVAHAQMPLEVNRWVHTFTIPLFMLLSGFLVSPEALAEPFREFFSRRLMRLLMAYFFFGAIGLVHAVAVSQVGLEREPLWPLLQAKAFSVLYGSGTWPDGNPWQLHPLALWFFPALLVGMVLFYFAVRQRAAIAWTLLAGMMLLALAAREWTLPWELETGLAAAPYIALGHLLRRRREWLAALRRLPILAALAVMVFCWSLSVFNDPSEFRLSQFGFAPAYWLISVATCAAWVALTVRLPAWAWVMRVSEATIFIFPTHQLVFWACDTVCRDGLRLSAVTMASYCYTLGMSAFALAFLTLIYRPARRVLPWL